MRLRWLGLKGGMKQTSCNPYRFGLQGIFIHALGLAVHLKTIADQAAAASAIPGGILDRIRTTCYRDLPIQSNTNQTLFTCIEMKDIGETEVACLMEFQCFVRGVKLPVTYESAWASVSRSLLREDVSCPFACTLWGIELSAQDHCKYLLSSDAAGLCVIPRRNGEFIVDLFSGVGGWSVGHHLANQAGIDIPPITVSVEASQCKNARRQSGPL